MSHVTVIIGISGLERFLARAGSDHPETPEKKKARRFRSEDSAAHAAQEHIVDVSTLRPAIHGLPSRIRHMRSAMITTTMANHPNRGRGAGVAANPKPAEIRAAREAAGLTQTEAAALVYSTLRTWQDWETDTVQNRRMHPAIWELWLIKTAHLRNKPPED